MKVLVDVGELCSELGIFLNIFQVEVSLRIKNI